MRITTIAVLLLAWAWACPVAARAAEPAVPDKGDGQRVMHVGNSHSHALRFLEPLAWAVGHAKHKDGDVNILACRHSVVSPEPGLFLVELIGSHWKRSIFCTLLSRVRSL
jgi:hypothetical protein